MNPSTETIAAPVLIRRCKWCVGRIGRPSYYLDGQWRPAENLPEGDFTDGICPDCFARQTRRLQCRPAKGGG